VAYDPALVPVGPRGTISARVAGTITTVTLEVSGLQPNRQYGAYAHTKRAARRGRTAGPHFQFAPDPVTSSVDPAYANPKNEIWLDLTTDAHGAGRAASIVDWALPADRRAESAIIHAMPTSTAPDSAGTAGDRAACITLGL
jgi:Cu-Zn family superoxide dismutase